MKPFNQPSYMTQVNRLRVMAHEVVRKEPIGAVKLKLINHGENATVRVTTQKKEYRVRLHRPGYHTTSALLEELSWLTDLSQETEIPVQSPVLSRAGSLIEMQESLGEERACDLL